MATSSVGVLPMPTGTGTPFRTDIEGLRAVAIALVVAAHAGVPWFAGGFIGVDVFFVLSGFLITGKLVQEVESTGQLRLLPFYVRRLRRLLPALLLMLVAVGFASTLLLSPIGVMEQGPALRMAALWLSNLYFALGSMDYFAAGSTSSLYLHTWSLGVEEQFYLVWPVLILWLVGRDGAQGIARLKIGLAVIALAGFIACVLMTRSEPLLAFYMMPLRAWQFAAGALVWLLIGQQATVRTSSQRFGSLCSVAGVSLIVLSGLFMDAQRSYPGAWALIPTLGAGLVVAAGSLGRGGAYALLSSRPFQWTGKISYSWYLWHWPVIRLGDAFVAELTPWIMVLLVLVSIGLALISHVVVEAPLRRWKGWLAHPVAAVVVSLGCMAGVAMLGTMWMDTARSELQSPEMQRYVKARSDAPIIYPMGCDEWFHSADVRTCAFGDENAEHTAVLIGDSHVGQWFPAIHRVLEKPGWRLLVMTKSSCAMVDAPFFYDRIGREYTECAQWRRDAIREIQEIEPDLVILGNGPYNFSAAQWINGTTRVLAQITPASRRVFLLIDTPEMPFDGPDCLARHATLSRWSPVAQKCSFQWKSAQTADAVNWVAEAVAPFPNVSALDMNEHVCPGDICYAELDGAIVYRDSHHLTSSFSASLWIIFDEALFGATPR